MNLGRLNLDILLRAACGMRQAARASSVSAADARPGMDTAFWPESSSSTVTPSASRPGFCRCARCCRRRNWSSGPRTARPTGDFRDVIGALSPSPLASPQPDPRPRPQPHPHPHPRRHPTYQPHTTMVGKVSERVLAREGKHPRAYATAGHHIPVACERAMRPG